LQSTRATEPQSFAKMFLDSSIGKFEDEEIENFQSSRRFFKLKLHKELYSLKQHFHFFLRLISLSQV